MTELQSLAHTVLEALTERTLTLSTAESLTGGLLAATLTSLPGSSAFYLGGVVPYATVMKPVLAGVDPDVLADNGAVSEQTAVEMVLGIQRLTGSDWAIALTGVAGPAGQEGHDPGTVWIAVASPQIGTSPAGVQTQLYDFAGDRDSVREQAVAAALNQLLTWMSPG